MTRSVPPAAPFTGRHMLMIMIAFFGVVIAVNLTMARLAGMTWSGLVVANSYVAGQSFDEKMRRAHAQIALDWTGRLELGGDRIGYGLSDRDGRPVPLLGVSMTFRHPAFEAADWQVTLSPVGAGRFEADHPVRDGAWSVEIVADAGRADPYREVKRITVVHGEMQ
ncbi:FixH family protein [Ensifer soli]|uniref:FixH family protein n=1 Tax=Ciceribacter sp. sgz301302 TaxID=3342379 RepID=UPI0035B825C6